MNVALARVRNDTASLHAALDAHVEPGDLVNQGSYAGVISGLVAAGEVVENYLDAALSALPPFSAGYDTVSKRAALDAERDFLERELGVGVVPVSDNAVAAFAAGTEPLTMVSVLGVAYVYVGSALGGATLLRQVQAAKWWRDDRPLLLSPYGDGLSARWRGLLSALGSLDEGEIPSLLEAARATFTLHLTVMMATPCGATTSHSQ